MIFDTIRFFLNAIVALWNIAATFAVLFGAIWISHEVGGWMGILAFFGFLMIPSNILDVVWISLIPSHNYKGDKITW